jgi:predicted lipid carrier protein YhbT
MIKQCLQLVFKVPLELHDNDVSSADVRMYKINVPDLEFHWLSGTMRKSEAFSLNAESLSKAALLIVSFLILPIPTGG